MHVHTLKSGAEYKFVSENCIERFHFESGSDLETNLRIPNNECGGYSVIISRNNGRLHAKIIGNTKA